MRGTHIPVLAALGALYSFSFLLVRGAPAPTPMPIAQDLSTPLPFSDQPDPATLADTGDVTTALDPDSTLQPDTGDITTALDPDSTLQPDTGDVATALDPDSTLQPDTGDITTELSPDPTNQPDTGDVTTALDPDSTPQPVTGDITTELSPDPTNQPDTGDVTTALDPDSTPQPVTGDITTELSPDSTNQPGTTAMGEGATVPVVVPLPTAPTNQASLTNPGTGPATPPQNTDSPQSITSPEDATPTQSLTGHLTTSPVSTFVAPLSTLTHSVTESSETPTGALYYATNPANPEETAAFGSTTLPPSERDGLPDATDAAPLALLLAGFAGVSLLFSNGLLVFPLVPAGLAAIPAWLTV
ncbi:MAG: hypothetical protein M1840_005541 [Geoglossum simile]|nr:MAG: hypothetical protein M1840_005541 [Geoglossum simile]